jgi:2-polyprenyl-3-methyl-5-hydroxy-6-metoxy-1,4-benzoquinol methylase
MAIRIDPEHNKIRALFEMAEFSGKHVLEIGCGDGNLTWQYADAAAHITAIDPFEPWIRRAKENLPDTLRDRVEFHNISIEEFAAASESEVFDVAILPSSL